ncbi:MAG TPA: hypothetical protein VHB48_05595, partial [Chitinophagaceae bacterium]|nr:hypothetical protein [Chitinophagaceae bacterium]
MIKKIVLAILGLLIIAAVGIWYYAFIWSAGHHRNVEDEKAIHTTAASLVAAYEENEHAADSIFLDKAVQVTGEVVLVQYN